METSALPAWAQAIFYVVIAVGTAGTGILSYIKKQAKSDPVPSGAGSPVVTASFIDSKVLKDLIDVLKDIQEDYSRDSKKTQRLMQELKEATVEQTEATIVQTDTTMNLVRFINREANKSKVIV